MACAKDEELADDSFSYPLYDIGIFSKFLFQVLRSSGLDVAVGGTETDVIDGYRCCGCLAVYPMDLARAVES